MADTLDFKRITLLAKLSQLVYQTDPEVLEAGVSALGLIYVGLYANDDCQVMVTREINGDFIAVTRGTQVEEHFSLQELWDDANPGHTNLGGNALVRSGAYDPLKTLWDGELHAVIDFGFHITFTGHSLGGQRSTIFPALLPPEVKPTVVAFAPPKGGNRAFWNACYADREMPLLVTRCDDFAPAFDPLDSVVEQCCRSLHLTSPGWEWLDHYPRDNASIGAHSVDLYVSDVVSINAAVTP